MHQRTLVVEPMTPADTFEASSATDTTTSSTSDVLATGMTLTPGAGDYLVWFSSSVEANTTGTNQYVSIYQNGSQVAHTEREIYTEGSINNTSFPIATHAHIISLGASQSIEIRWRTTGISTATMHERTLVLQKIDSADISTATASGDTTTTSATDVLATPLSITPGAGDYLVWFSGSLENTSAGTNFDQFVSLYVNGTQVAHTEREITTEESLTNTPFPFAGHAYVTGVGASDDIEVRWRTENGTATMHERTLVVQAQPPSGKKTFNSVGNTYWYADTAWPTGNDDASIASGNYTFNMYFNSLPPALSWYDSNWNYRKQITVQNSQVGSNETLFPVYVDLADLGADFFSNVNADGGDIRVTNSDGTTELAREVVDVNTGAQTGELHFRADSLSSSSPTSFYIYYGNIGASDYAFTATHGRNAVWSNNYSAVYHLEEEAAGITSNNLYIDSTGNGNDGDDRVSATGQLGQLGAGQELDGSDDFVDMGDVLDFADPANFTLESWIRPTIPAGGAITVEGTNSGDVIQSGPTPHKISFSVTCAGTNRLLLIGISNFPEASDSVVSGVTVNGSSAGIDRLDGSGIDMYVLETGNDAEASIYKKVAPASGSNTVEVAFSPNFTNSGAIAGAICLSGVDQTTPLGNWNSNKGNSAGPAGVNVTSATNELVFSVAAMEKATALSSDGDTDHWAYSITTNNDTPGGGGSTVAGAASVTTTWTWTASLGDHWAMGAVPILPASGGLSDQMSFITKWGTVTSDRVYRFEVETDATLTFLPGGGVNPNLNSTTVMNTDTWYHAAVSVQPSADSIGLYLNGSQEDSTSTWTGVIPNGTTNFNLGRRQEPSQWFDGNLDEARISSTNRDADWIGTSFNNQNSTTSFYTVAGQESNQSVDITVYVHHTATDGTGATLITSASITIDGNTADPLVFDVGNDPIGQTFTSADPRVLRVQVEVTAVKNGGSFVLDYDGPCASNACSSLDTPVVVVPEFGLIFGAFVLLIPVAMGGVWRRRRMARRARAAHGPFAHSQIKSRQKIDPRQAEGTQ